jgi:hypothetical protein
LGSLPAFLKSSIKDTKNAMELTEIFCVRSKFGTKLKKLNLYWQEETVAIKIKTFYGQAEMYRKEFKDILFYTR